jgi:hypothetical protein
MILLALSSLFIIGIPLMSGNDHWTDYYLSVLLATSPTLLTLIPFYSSFVSETNASPGERTFLFSRPITRNVYL